MLQVKGLEYVIVWDKFVPHYSIEGMDDVCVCPEEAGIQIGEVATCTVKRIALKIT